jgi:hypothetical protein
MHQLVGIETSQINNFLLNLSLRGIARNKLHIVKQAYPITPDILLKMFDSFDFVSMIT